MRFHPFHLAPTHPSDAIVADSRISILIEALACLIFPILGIVILQTHGPIFMGWIFIALGSLFSLHIYLATWRALSSENWQLRYNASRLLIRISPSLPRKLNNVSVLELQMSEIAWIRAYRDTTVNEGSDSDLVTSYAYLEITPRNPDLSALQEQITRISVKKRQWKHGSSTTITHIPISTTSAGQIRIAFRSPYNWLTPSLDRTIAALSQYLPVHPAISEHNDYTIPIADKAKMEQQILELTEKGQLLQATTLARKRYGYSLAQARQFIEDLRTPRPPTTSS